MFFSHYKAFVADKIDTAYMRFTWNATFIIIHFAWRQNMDLTIVF